VRARELREREREEKLCRHIAARNRTQPPQPPRSQGAKLSAARATHMRPRVAAQEKSHVKACRGCVVLAYADKVISLTLSSGLQIFFSKNKILRTCLHPEAPKRQ
jgi:hypothetical protein